MKRGKMKAVARQKSGNQEMIWRGNRGDNQSVKSSQGKEGETKESEKIQ